MKIDQQSSAINADRDTAHRSSIGGPTYSSFKNGIQQSYKNRDPSKNKVDNLDPEFCQTFGNEDQHDKVSFNSSLKRGSHLKDNDNLDLN